MSDVLYYASNALAYLLFLICFLSLFGSGAVERRLYAFSATGLLAVLVECMVSWSFANYVVSGGAK